MMVGEALRQLDVLLGQEEKALVTVDLERVVRISAKKAELLQVVEIEFAKFEGELPVAAVALVRGVHIKARKNKFLLSHLRNSLCVVEPKRTQRDISSQNY